MVIGTAFLLIPFFAIPALAQESEHTHCGKAEAQFQLAHARGLSTFEDLSFDLHYYRFEWYIDPAVYSISGAATAYFTSKIDGLDQLEFNLSTQLTVDAVQYHGTVLPFTQSGDYGLSIQLPAALALNTLDSLSIRYHGAPPSGGFGSFIQSSHNGTPILWTLSEPYGAQDWWPCKNGLTDKIDSLDVFIRTPGIYRAASNGKLVGEVADGNEAVYHWQHRYPIAPYLIAIAVTNYVQYTDNVPLKNGVTMPMLNYVYPEQLQAAQSGTGELVRALQFYDSLFVTYPFYQEKYGHAQFGWGGGMEHQTMSYVVNYSWGLLTHELAHQWFGDMVTCGSWEDIWLNEGFATYLEGISRERFHPGDWTPWKQGRINSITGQAGGSVRVDDTSSVGRIFSGRLTYNKGAYLLHMLRWKLGNEAFFQGVRNYLEARRFNYAITPQFKAHLEAASGQNLTEYFADWYYGQGYPSYQLLWSQDAGKQLSLTLSQTQSHPSVSFFEMPVPIRFFGPQGDTTLVVQHTASGQQFSISLPFEVENAQIDPELWLITANNTVTKGTTSSVEANTFAALDIAPNPCVARTQISLQSGATIARIELFDLQGKLLKTFSGVHSTRQELDLSQWPAGCYEVRVFEGDAIHTGKIIRN